jgi:hypothetical protein
VRLERETRKTSEMTSNSGCGHELPDSGFLVVRLASRGYRGIDRGALEATLTRDPAATQVVPLAETRLGELRGGSYCPYCDCGFLTNEADAADVLAWAELEEPGGFELVWARIAGTECTPPNGYERLGFEPTWFWSNHFSPVWHTLCGRHWPPGPHAEPFTQFADRLNADGLFGDAATATEFLTCYRSFPWTETGDYEIAEVWAPTS